MTLKEVTMHECNAWILWGGMYIVSPAGAVHLPVQDMPITSAWHLVQHAEHARVNNGRPGPSSAPVTTLGVTTTYQRTVAVLRRRDQKPKYYACIRRGMQRTRFTAYINDQSTTRSSTVHDNRPLTPAQRLPAQCRRVQTKLKLTN